MRNVALCLAIAALLAGCAARSNEQAAGAAAISRYGCGSCHNIPGVTGAHGLVGPPLGGIGRRMYVAGELPNTPENLQHWVRHPTSVHPHTVMPELGVTEKDAGDISALLYSLK